MKSTEFKWSWGDHAPQPDKLMNRSRAARLIAAWRRSARLPSNCPNVYRLDRISAGVYRAYSSYGETGTIYISRR